MPRPRGRQAGTGNLADLLLRSAEHCNEQGAGRRRMGHCNGEQEHPRCRLADRYCVCRPGGGNSPGRGYPLQGREEGIAILATELPVFDIALKIHEAGDI